MQKTSPSKTSSTIGVQCQDRVQALVPDVQMYSLIVETEVS